MCGLPQASVVIGETDMEPCLTMADMRCTASAYSDLYKLQDREEVTGCPGPCVTASTSARIREDATKDRGNFTYVYVLYATTMVLVNEEYR